MEILRLFYRKVYNSKHIISDEDRAATKEEMTQALVNDGETRKKAERIAREELAHSAGLTNDSGFIRVYNVSNLLRVAHFQSDKLDVSDAEVVTRARAPGPDMSVTDHFTVITKGRGCRLF